jgi:hypothetical protein
MSELQTEMPTREELIDYAIAKDQRDARQDGALFDKDDIPPLAEDLGKIIEVAKALANDPEYLRLELEYNKAKTNDEKIQVFQEQNPYLEEFFTEAGINDHHQRNLVYRALNFSDGHLKEWTKEQLLKENKKLELESMERESLPVNDSKLPSTSGTPPVAEIDGLSDVVSDLAKSLVADTTKSASAPINFVKLQINQIG